LFKLYPNPPLPADRRTNEDLVIPQIHAEISKIDPMLLLSHKNVLWYSIKSMLPSILEKTFAFNEMIQRGNACVIYVPSDFAANREKVLDTMQFIASR
jgi:hypothetical protein